MAVLGDIHGIIELAPVVHSLAPALDVLVLLLPLAALTVAENLVGLARPGSVIAMAVVSWAPSVTEALSGLSGFLALSEASPISARPLAEGGVASAVAVLLLAPSVIPSVLCFAVPVEGFLQLLVARSTMRLCPRVHSHLYAPQSFLWTSPAFSVSSNPIQKGEVLFCLPFFTSLFRK